MRVVGCDIGGANIKMADSDRSVRTCSFEMWSRLDQLSTVLRDMLDTFDTPDCLAVTLTAELADCFETKSQGVNCVLDHVAVAAGDVPVYVWQTGCEFVPSHVAREIPLLVAAANWHALATWLGRMEPDGVALLIDIGSTTTDIIPLCDGVPVAVGLTDRERLQSGELVYTGTWRTPVSSIARTVEIDGVSCPLAAEVFATILDVYLLLEDIPENPACSQTANRRPATRQAAVDRLLRMCCCDRTEMTDDHALEIARQVAELQMEQLKTALRRVINRQSSRPKTVLLSGSGEFLARRLVEQVSELDGVSLTYLSQVFHPEWAEAACACAVARLGAERLIGIEQ